MTAVPARWARVNVAHAMEMKRAVLWDPTTAWSAVAGLDTMDLAAKEPVSFQFI